MADIADKASDYADELLKQTLVNRQKFDTESKYECLECGSEIPEQRRALGNVTLCVGCQTALESNLKHYR